MSDDNPCAPEPTVNTPPEFPCWLDWLGMALGLLALADFFGWLG